MNNIVVLIPAYNPNQKLINLVSELKNNFSKIIIINDGSNRKSKKIFQELTNYPECTLLEYPENKGKGYALKYGINYYLENLKDNYQGIVTADCDYQHKPEDIINIALKLLGNQDSIILGVRNFHLKNIPFPNRFGNLLTSFIFKFLYGIKIEDTQTGLRAIPNRYLNLCLETNGNRFEFEMNMLIKAVKNKINILQVPIETIYYSKRESKFNKFKDPIIIYKVLFTEYLKFIISSLSCSLIDVILFSMFLQLFINVNNNIQIIMATFFSRIITDFFNFNINKTIVFNSNENIKKIAIKYYILSFSKMIISALFVLLIHHLLININETYIKIVVDTLIYFLSYKIQKKYIFKT
ncbi:MAG: glycosyltransferase [Bacilli bacterium]